MDGRDINLSAEFCIILFVISSALFDNSQAASGKINGASICNVVCLYLCNMRVAAPEIK